MSPLAYFNFEDAGTTISENLIVGGQSLSGVAQGDTDNGIRKKHAYIASLASGFINSINYSGEQSFAFWYRGTESSKPGNPTHPGTLPTFQVSRSGTIDERAFYKTTITHDGTINYNVNGTSVLKSGIDVGRWNFVYCEYDPNNSRIGLSVNAGNKTYSNYSGSIPNTQSKLYLMSSNNYKHNIDELGFWSGCLNQTTLLDYYSNFRGYSYSGSLDDQWMYPQNDAYVVSSGSTYDWPNELGSYYSDPLLVSEVNPPNRWEWINESDAYSSPGETTALYSNINNSNGKKIKVNLGKLYIRPSSVQPIIRAYPALLTGSQEGSGYLSEFYLYDKNNLQIAGGFTSGNATSYYGQGNASFAIIGQTTFNNIIYDNRDLSDTYATFAFKNYDTDGYFGIQDLRVYVSGTAIAHTGLDLVGSGGQDNNSSMDLYTLAYSSGFASKDLYIAGHIADNSGIPLYMYGAQPVNSGLDLFINGWDTRSSGLDLYIGGHIPSNSGLDLYLTAHANIAQGMNLFTKYSPVEKSGGFNLFTFAATDSSIQAGMDLYLKTALARSVVGNLNLFISGPASGLSYGEMPLYLENNTLTSQSVELFLKNAYESGFKSLKLNIRGEGTLDNGLPANGSMPLYISRVEAVENSIPLYLGVNDGVSSGLNMYMNGGTWASSGLDLTISNTYAIYSGVVELYTHGF